MTVVFANSRPNYLLNLSGAGTEVVDKSTGGKVTVPYGEAMSFAGVTKYSKDSGYIAHHVRSHAEAYANWNSIIDTPVDLLRTGTGYLPWTSANTVENFQPRLLTQRLPDRPDKVIVGYVNLTEFTAIGKWDPSFDPAWDKDGDALIDADAKVLPSYVDTKAFNAPWKGYAAAYWTDSWKQQIQKKIDMVAIENFDGVMFDCMNEANLWIKAYPNMDKSWLQQQIAELLKWASNYAKSTYGSEFLITVNLDYFANEYFSDIGKYVDAGYFQNAYFDGGGSGKVTKYVSPAQMDFIKSQGMSLLNMDHLGTGNVPPGLNFINHDDQLTYENFQKIFQWAIATGSTPYVTQQFMGLPYTGTPRFVRVYPDSPVCIGTKYNDWVIGSDASDLIRPAAGNDVVYGGRGVDTVAYSGVRSSFQLAKQAGEFLVIDKSGSEGTDKLTAVERLQFADKTFELVDPPRQGVPAYGQQNGFLFDAVFYLLDNPELVPTQTLATALQHYFSTGAAQGKQPNSWFDPTYYENRWPDLKAGNFSDDILFMHYNLYGVWEGRSAGPKFDKFDGNRYLNDNPDVAAYVDSHLPDFLGSRSNGAIAHFVIYGQHELRLAFDLVGQPIDLGYTIDLGG